jgi:acyl carrier protein
MFEFVCKVLREMAVMGILPSHIATEPLASSNSLVDLGIDSLGSMTLFSEIAGRLSLSTFDIDLNPNMTLGDIAELLGELHVVQPESAP